MDVPVVNTLLTSLNRTEQDQLFEAFFNIADKFYNITRRIRSVLEQTENYDCSYLAASKVVCDQANTIYNMGKNEQFMQKFVVEKMQNQTVDDINIFQTHVVGFSKEIDIIFPLYQKFMSTARVSLHDIISEVLQYSMPLLTK